MRRGVLVIVMSAVLGSVAGFGGWLLLGNGGEEPQEEPKPTLDEWLVSAEQQMLVQVVESARQEEGWAAGCLWREEGDIRSIVFPPEPAIVDDGMLPEGRRFSVLRGAGQSSGQYVTIEDDAHFCIVPSGRGRSGEEIIRAW